MVIIDLRRNDSRGYHTSQKTDCLVIATYLPPISIGTSSEPHRNLIGTSPKDYREITERKVKHLHDKNDRNLAPSILLQKIVDTASPQSSNKKECHLKQRLAQG